MSPAFQHHLSLVDWLSKLEALEVSLGDVVDKMKLKMSFPLFGTGWSQKRQLWSGGGAEDGSGALGGGVPFR